MLFSLFQLLFFSQVIGFNVTIQLFGGPQNNVTISAVEPLQQVNHFNMRGQNLFSCELASTLLTFVNIVSVVGHLVSFKLFSTL